jgi:hypothetical protein
VGVGVVWGLERLENGRDGVEAGRGDVGRAGWRRSLGRGGCGEPTPGSVTTDLTAMASTSAWVRVDRVVVAVAAVAAVAALVQAAPLTNLASVTLDVRPHTTAQYASDPNGVFAQYLTLLQSCGTAWRQSGAAGDFIVAAPSWYSLNTFTLGGTSRTFLEWATLAADVISVVTPFDNAADLVHWAGPACAFAANNGRKCHITVDTTTQQALGTTFANDGRQQMQYQLGQVDAQLAALVGDAWLGTRVIDAAGLGALGNSANGMVYTPGAVPIEVYVPVAPEGMTLAYVASLWNLFGSVQPGFAITGVVYPRAEQLLLGTSAFTAMVAQAQSRNASVQILLTGNDWTFTSQHPTAVATINSVAALVSFVRALDGAGQPTTGPTAANTQPPAPSATTPVAASTPPPPAGTTTTAPTLPGSTGTPTTAVPTSGGSTGSPTTTQAQPTAPVIPTGTAAQSDAASAHTHLHTLLLAGAATTAALAWLVVV